MFRVKEIRSRVFFTLIVLAVFRLGSVLTIPGINPEALTALHIARGLSIPSAMDATTFLKGRVQLVSWCKRLLRSYRIHYHKLNNLYELLCH